MPLSGSIGKGLGVSVSGQGPALFPLQVGVNIIRSLLNHARISGSVLNMGARWRYPGRSVSVRLRLR